MTRTGPILLAAVFIAFAVGVFQAVRPLLQWMGLF